LNEIASQDKVCGAIFFLRHFFQILRLYIWNLIPYWSIVFWNTTEWFFSVFFAYAPTIGVLPLTGFDN